MTLPIDTRNPIGKLDFDTEDRNLPPQHYRYGKNGRSGTSDRDGDGAVENIRGNVLRNDSYQNRGFVIGSCPDVKNNAVIYFVYQSGNQNITFTSAVATVTFDNFLSVTDGSEDFPINTRLKITQGANVFYATVNGSTPGLYTLTVTSGAIVSGDAVTEIIRLNSLNRIERYSDSTGLFENLTNPELMGDVLNFSNTARIYNPRVIESTFGQLLAWTDAIVNPPRLMNIDYMKTGGIYYSTANSDQYITLAKQPPLVTPSVEFLTSLTPPISYFINYFFQFRYRYVFDDGQISSMSDISDVALTDPNFSLIQNYAISVGVDSGPKTVKYVQILVREGNGVSSGDINPEWYIWKVITKATEPWNDNTVYYVNYLNNEDLVSVAKIDSDVNFYAVPQLAGSLEVVNNSQIVLANITEGYDNVTVSGTVTEKKIFGYLVCSMTAGQFVIPNIIDNYQINDDIYLAFYASGSGGQQISPVLDSSSFVNFYTSVVSYFNGIPGVVAILLGATADQASISLNFTADFIQFSYNYTSDSPLVNRGVKTNSILPIGFVYYDEYLRSTGVNVLDDSYQQGGNITFTLDTISGLGDYALTYHIPHLLITNTTTPPSGFTKYKILVKESNIGTFMECKYTLVGTKIRLAETWDFSVGDRVRWNEVNITTGVITIRDYAILSYDISNNELNLGDIDATVTAGNVVAPFGVVEVYSPQSSALWFETDRLYDLSETSAIEITGNSYFAVFKAEGNTGTSAELIGTFRNTPIAYAYTLGGTTVSDNRMTINNKYDNYWWKGRVNVETPNQKRLRIGTLIRWSGVLINNTQVNNLNVFDSGNYNNEINARFGDITGMRQIGYTLKIVQWSNMNSAFLGRKQIQNADGSTQLVVTDSLIGTINPSEMEYGTKYPGSIISTGRRVYYFDSIKSRFIVDDGNGINEVAMYMGKDGAPSSTMSKYFRSQSSIINADSNFQIITGFDYLYRDLYLSFVNYTEKVQETLYYNEDQNAWKYFMDMESKDENDAILNIIDCYGNVGQSFFGFLQANTYQFNKLLDGDTPKYSTLFKVNETDPLKPLIVETIGMIEPDKVKIMQSHWIHCNKPIELVEISIPSNTMYPNGMYTVLKAPNFAYREGVYYADIKNDMYTNGVPGTEAERRQAIANGRKMRGHVCLVRITYISDDYVKLYSSGIGMIPSELS